MKITRKKALVIGSATVLLTGAAASASYVALAHTKELRYDTQSALRAALPAAATAELAARGVTLGRGLTCTDMRGWTKKKMRVSCTGRTADRHDVRVLGSGEDATQDQWYTILIAGKPVVQNAGCLGKDCGKRE
ncbi:hypothetical protein [Actinomadura parmotrematis]|uniref:DUF4333 domain-containing protein n=1 Tax=Actinomadura parmotrematis TaxID=2864039 RepID=A0ABS7FZB0_9ACTN|nr:hypothetical protein [Actinomadura parmotrematis]MBW8485779.1 hypothetical protein [Actinomadura parmotrematis]